MTIESPDASTLSREMIDACASCIRQAPLGPRMAALRALVLWASEEIVTEGHLMGCLEERRTRRALPPGPIESRRRPPRPEDFSPRSGRAL